MKAGMDWIITHYPVPLKGVDFDNGTEFFRTGADPPDVTTVAFPRSPGHAPPNTTTTRTSNGSVPYSFDAFHPSRDVLADACRLAMSKGMC